MPMLSARRLERFAGLHQLASVVAEVYQLDDDGCNVLHARAQQSDGYEGDTVNQLYEEPLDGYNLEDLKMWAAEDAPVAFAAWHDKQYQREAVSEHVQKQRRLEGCNVNESETVPLRTYYQPDAEDLPDYVEVREFDARFIHDHELFDTTQLDTPVLQNVDQFDAVWVRSPPGSGKTTAYTKMILRALDETTSKLDNECVVVMPPTQALANKLENDLSEAQRERSGRARTLNYLLVRDHKVRYSEAHQLLVCTPMSMPRLATHMGARPVRMVVVDEVSQHRRMAESWIQKDGTVPAMLTRMEISMQGYAEHSQWRTVLLGADIVPADIRWARQKMYGNINREPRMLLLDNTHRHRHVEIIIYEEPRMWQDQLARTVQQNLPVYLFADTVPYSEVAASWLIHERDEFQAAEKNSTSPIVLLNSRTDDKLKAELTSNPTAYVAVNRPSIMVCTPAMPLGASIDNRGYFHSLYGRFTGRGPGVEDAVQYIQRVRDCQVLHLLFEDGGDGSEASDPTINALAVQRVRKAFGDAGFVVTNSVTSTGLQSTVSVRDGDNGELTRQRVALQVEKMQLRRPGEFKARFLQECARTFADSSTVTVSPPTIPLPRQPRTLFLQAQQKLRANKCHEAQRNTVHYTRSELAAETHETLARTHRDHKKQLQQGQELARAIRVHEIVNRTPLHLVDEGGRTDHHLTPRMLTTLSNNYNRFDLWTNMHCGSALDTLTRREIDSMDDHALKPDDLKSERLVVVRMLQAVGVYELWASTGTRSIAPPVTRDAQLRAREWINMRRERVCSMLHRAGRKAMRRRALPISSPDTHQIDGTRARISPALKELNDETTSTSENTWTPGSMAVASSSCCDTVSIPIGTPYYQEPVKSPRLSSPGLPTVDNELEEASDKGWAALAQSVFIDLIGMGLRKCNRSNRMQLKPRAMWQHIGDPVALLEWQRSGAAKGYGPPDAVMTRCAMCEYGKNDHDMRSTLCVRQEGVYRCVFPPTGEKNGHRVLNAPLDVPWQLNSNAVAEMEDPGSSTGMQIELSRRSELSTTVSANSIQSEDSLLVALGFPSGAGQTTLPDGRPNQVLVATVKERWAAGEKAVDSSLLKEVDKDHDTEFSRIPHTNNVKRVVKFLNEILRKRGVEVTLKRASRSSPTSAKRPRVYRLVAVVSIAGSP